MLKYNQNLKKVGLFDVLIGISDRKSFFFKILYIYLKYFYEQCDEIKNQM